MLARNGCCQWMVEHCLEYLRREKSPRPGPSRLNPPLDRFSNGSSARARTKRTKSRISFQWKSKQWVITFSSFPSSTLLCPIFATRPSITATGSIWAILEATTSATVGMMWVRLVGHVHADFSSVNFLIGFFQSFNETFTGIKFH